MTIRSRTATVLLTTLLASVALLPSTTAGHEYEQPVWFEWDTFELDIYVEGANDPLIGKAIQDAVAAWQAGVDELGASWLKDNLVLRVYDPAVDPVPPAGFEAHDIEIYVQPQGFFAVQASWVPTSGQECYAFAPLAHEWAYTDNGLYRVALHEIGHCLGLGHIYNHGREYSPDFDPMGGGRDLRACPSNLNLRVMESAFADLVGQPDPNEVSMDSNKYVQASC